MFPVGNGGLFLGAWRGFNELLDAGRIDRIPRLHAVQAANVMPIAAGFLGRAWGQGGHAADNGGRHIGRVPGLAARRSST